MRRKLCPVCGEKIVARDVAKDGRIIGSCGDAFWATTDKLGRETWHARRPRNYRRNDLWAVQVYEDCGNRPGWVIQAIFKRPVSAEQFAEDTYRNVHRPYPLVMPELFHPQNWIVDAFVAAGNTIQE